MEFTIYASGSAGNCYELDDGKTRILLECGLSPKKLHGIVAGKLGEYAGVLVTHEHMDHARAAAHCVTMGLPVYMTEGTFSALDVPNLPNLHGIKADEPFPVGSYDVLPLRAYHDATEPVCFLIHSRADGESLLFATDTGVLHHPTAGVTILALECNHEEESLAADEKMPKKTIERIRRTHLSFERLVRCLSCCDLSKTREIVLLHLSNRHSRAEAFAQSITARFGIPARFE